MLVQSLEKKTVIQAMCIFACLMVIVSLTGCAPAAPVTPAASNTPAEQVATTPAEETPAATAPEQTPAATKPVTIPAASKSAYKDGTYTVDGEYRSPAGPETIGVTLTLKNDIVTDAVVVAHATVPKSKMLQDAFIGGFKAMVVGKNIKDVNVGKISGSSLTPKGFNDAVAKIKVQAQA